MFRLNLKIAWRNLWKNKAYSAINIFGLAAGLTGFIIILLYINKETGYDKWDPALKQTYQVGISRTKNGAEIKEPLIDGHFVKMIRERFPQVELVTRGNWGGTPRSIDYIYNHQTFQPNFNMAGADSLFFKTYPIKALYGKMEDIFTTPKAVAISLTKAKEIFGDINPVNKTLTRKGGANFKDEDLIVKAVWDDQKYRSYFKMSMISAIDFKTYGDEEMDVSYSVILKLHDNTAIAAFTQKINDEYLKEQAKRAINNSDPNFKLTVAKAKEILSKNDGITNQTIIIEPVQDLNLNSFFSPNPKQKSIYVLVALATFLIIISCVNFTNLAIVQATGRAKEVGVKKVLGAFRFTLAKQFLAETAMQCLLAFFIALVSVELLLPTVNTMLATELTLFTNEQLKVLLLQSLGIVLSIVVLAGLYPALFLSGFMPAKVLKGNFSGNLGTVTLRKGLMILQFTIAGVLVISFLIMNNQLNFMKNKDLGMQADQIMVLSINDYGHRKLNPEQFSSIKQRLENIKGVMQVSRSTDGIVGEGGWKKDFSYQGKTTQLIARYNDLNYLNILKANILKGRDFSERFIATDTLNNVIINETALKTMGLKQGVGEAITFKNDDDELQRFNVIGVVKDIQNEGFDKSIKPTVYLASDYQWHWRRVALISLSNENIAETIAQVKKVWKEIEPAVDPSYSFADEKFAALNAAYERMARVMFSFSTITLLVSILGLFTLAAYTAKIRIKEIAIRKILGASTASILQLLNADLVKLVIIANILGDVFAYIYMNKWFEEFVYRIDMPILPFLIVNIGTIMITIITVSLQSLNAVRANPVNALKYE